jgi:transaldolase
MTRLDALYLDYGQSAWVDNIRRDWLNDGTLQDLVDRGVRGVTSNPSIFAKAVATTPAYDGIIADLGLTDAEEAFEALAVADVQDACRILRPVYDASVRELAAGTRRSTDGYVSLEVSPRLAHDTQGTVEAARRLATRVGDHPNLMIKIPATKAGLPAISEVLGLGISVNVTLIFSLERYQEVLDAFVAGIQRAKAHGHELSGIASVASFFISRVDSAIDPLLADESPLRGSIANAQAAAAYQLFLDHSRSAAMSEILASGGQIQRPLWASTSTKNPAYDELLYVDTLAAAETVNTMPDPTLEAFARGGDPSRSALSNDASRTALASHLEQLADVGISLSEITDTLERDGVTAFVTSYDELLATVASKLQR